MFDYKKLLKAYMELVGTYEGVYYAPKLTEGTFGLTKEEIEELIAIEEES